MKRFRRLNSAQGLMISLSLGMGLSLSLVTSANAQIVEWSEAPGPLGLGYPVPIPVDTPLPFDGFRTYNGLHIRHQDLSMTTPWVHGSILGQTHYERDVWLYQLGDEDKLTVEGLPEPAMLINGGIHAREWQSPEVVTGVIELLATAEGDPVIDYLRDNVNALVIPVLNVDGFLQTQRYPTSNYLGTNPNDPPNDPEPSPRDGRMRRKNLLNTDEVLETAGDHLRGVDLNRNNAPYWSTSNSSSPQQTSLLYHGPAPGSEPEIQALQDAAQTGPEDQLRWFADMHSFTRVFFTVLTNNSRRNSIQSRLVNVLQSHHQSLPGNQFYANSPDAVGRGIGTTSEFFAEFYQVPSWTWEIEPGNNAGAQYGGLRTNGHDGFILPESQIRRVRENLAQSIATGFYHMAGPPNITGMRIVDDATGAIVVLADWVYTGGEQRELDMMQLQELEVGHSYTLWAGFSKPMRWRVGGDAIAPYPGQAQSTLDFDFSMLAGNNFLNLQVSGPQWQDEPGGAPDGYQRYRDDAVRVPFTITDNANNRNALRQLQSSDGRVQLRITTSDLTGHQLDAKPATVATYRNGNWVNYENNSGVAGDLGGTDNSLFVAASPDPVAPLFLVEQGTSATWFDPNRNGEGVMLEVYDDGRSGMAWLTYDEEGNTRWLVGIGQVIGNRIVFPNLQVTTGGVFGPDYDPDAIVRTTAANAELLFTSCDQGWFSFSGFGQSARYPVGRASRTMAIDCNPPPDAVLLPQAEQSGSWYDPSQDGSGVNLQWVVTGQLALLWFTYSPEGEQIYIFGTGILQGDEVVFPNVNITRGARFGDEFDPADVERIRWGSLRMQVGCTTGTLQYDSVLPGYGRGELQLERLTILAGLTCTEAR